MEIHSVPSLYIIHLQKHAFRSLNITKLHKHTPSPNLLYIIHLYSRFYSQTHIHTLEPLLTSPPYSDACNRTARPSCASWPTAAPAGGRDASASGGHWARSPPSSTTVFVRTRCRFVVREGSTRQTLGDAGGGKSTGYFLCLVIGGGTRR